MTRYISWLVLLTLSWGCGPDSTSPKESTLPTIVVTLPVIGLLASPIADGFAIEVLLKNGQSPHGFQVSPTQAKQLSNTPLLLYAHPSIDGWAAELASESLSVWNGHRDADAHYWADPKAAIEALGTLSERLCTLKPTNCATFRERASKFSTQIDSVSESISGQLQAVKGECFVVAHQFMTQFLDRFGITSIGPIQPLPGHDASPRTLATMMGEAERLKCKTLLVQRSTDNRAMYSLAADLNLKVVEVDPTGSFYDSYEAYLGSLSDALMTSLQ